MRPPATWPGATDKCFILFPGNKLAEPTLFEKFNIGFIWCRNAKASYRSIVEYRVYTTPLFK